MKDDEAFNRRDEQLRAGYDEQDDEDTVCPECGGTDIFDNGDEEYLCNECEHVFNQ